MSSPELIREQSLLCQTILGKSAPTVMFLDKMIKDLRKKIDKEEECKKKTNRDTTYMSLRLSLKKAVHIRTSFYQLEREMALNRVTLYKGNTITDFGEIDGWPGTYWIEQALSESSE